MKGEELLDLFEDLDDELIEEAGSAAILPIPAHKRGRTWLIACVAILLVLSAPAFFLFSGLFKGSVTTDDKYAEEPSGGMFESGSGGGNPSDGLYSGEMVEPSDESIEPPEESVAPWSEPDPVGPSEGELLPTVLCLRLVSEFRLEIEKGVVVSVQSVDGESGKTILEELTAQNLNPVGMPQDKALFKLFDAMLKKGEYAEGRSVYLTLQSSGDALANPQDKEAFLESCEQSFQNGAQNNGLTLQIVINDALE